MTENNKHHTFKPDEIPCQEISDPAVLSKNPLVSVNMITYNHEPYIAQAIEGVLIQKTDFPIELVIGEDCSTDRTRKIVLDYQKKYPEMIRVITAKENVGMQKNGLRTSKACRGKYIAFCEGDDYWTDPNKLQKQVDFLESHPECVICFHNVNIIYDSKRDKKSHPFYVQGPSLNFTHRVPKPITTLSDLLNGNFIHTPSVMFRAQLFEEFPDWFYRADIGDWPLHVLNAQHGNMGYIDEVMAAYRVHSGGTWSSRSRVEVLDALIHTAELIKESLSFENRKIINNTIYRWYMEAIEILRHDKELRRASSYAKKCLMRFGLNKKIPVFKLVLIGYFPEKELQLSHWLERHLLWRFKK